MTPVDKIRMERRHARQRCHGFTLIELLVVIAIIALLASLLLPSLTKAKERGRRVVCAANLHTIYLGIVMYADDNNGKLPYSTSYTFPLVDVCIVDNFFNPPVRVERFFTGCLVPGYIANGAPFFCPSNMTVKFRNKIDWSDTYGWYNNQDITLQNSSEGDRYYFANIFSYQYYGGAYRKHSAGWNSPQPRCADNLSDPGESLVMGDIAGMGNPLVAPISSMNHIASGQLDGANVIRLNGAAAWYNATQLTVSPASYWLIPPP